MKNTIHIILSLVILFSVSCNSDKQTKDTLSNQKTTQKSPKKIVVEEDFELGDTSFRLPNSQRFDVDEVQIAREFLAVNQGKKIFENQLNREIIFMSNEHENAQLVVDSYNNILIQTIHTSFDEHRPLVLSPDIIWLAITQGTSIHINENFKSLEKVIFKKNKPKKLIIRNDSLEHDGRHWQELVSSLSNETKKYTNSDFYSFFVPKFSTTTPTQVTAYQVTLLNSYKKAFEYVGESGCGIPYITVTGTKEDWELIYSRLKELDKLGLKYWRIELEPIIQEFINVFDDKANVVFWQDIYKSMFSYRGLYSSGWIIKFFPYIPSLAEDFSYDEKTGTRKFEKIFIKNEFLEGNKYLLSTLSTSDFPSSIVEIDITLNNHFKNENKEINLYAGFFAIKQYPDKSLEPVISWAVCEREPKLAKHNLKRCGKDYQMPHQDQVWSPFIIDSITNSAIYNPREFKTSATSIEFVKQKIKEDLEESLKGINVSKDTVSFIVLINGKIHDIEFTGNKKAKNSITKTLNSLDKEWFPALTSKRNLDLMDDSGNGDVKIKVNSKIIIPLN